MRYVLVIAVTALAAALLPAGAQDAENGDGPPPYADNGQGPPPGYGTAYAPQCNPANYAPYQAIPPACMPQAYCDQYGCPDDFYDMPIWYGPVFYDNAWFGGPVYYRVWQGRRQYWIHGGWHYDAWIGARPSWWNASLYHTGPALGRNFHGRGAAANATNSIRVWRGTQASIYHDDGGQYFGRGFANPQTSSQARLRPIGHVSLQAHPVARQIPAPSRSRESHNVSRASGSKSGSDGHHGR